MRPNLQFLVDSVTFTEENLNGKLHFLCSDIEQKNYLSNSQQEYVFDLFIKICFFNFLCLVSLTWLFSILFSNMLSSIGWFSIPSLLTTVLSSLKKGDCLYFSENDSHDTRSVWSNSANMCLKGIKFCLH